MKPATHDADGVPYNGADLDEYLRTLDDEQLTSLKLDTLEHISAIKNQLDSPRARTDEQWARKANIAGRMYGYRMTCISAEEGRRKREKKDENRERGVRWERAFVDAVRQTLPPAQYQQLVKMADRIVHNERLEADRKEVRRLNESA